LIRTSAAGQWRYERRRKLHGCATTGGRGEPHGHPIPTREGALDQRELQPCARSSPAGQRVLIREAQDDNPERLRRRQALGLTPGAVVVIVSYQPLDDIFEVKVGSRVIPLGSEGLAGLRGEVVV